MKIQGIEATNFKGIEKIDVMFNDGHTRIIGLNGSGKTSLIHVMQACLKGVSQKSSNGELVGERFRFIGTHKKTADLKVTLKDEKRGFEVVITNKISKSSNAIEFKSSDGSTLDRQWLKDFFNVAFFSAKNFISRTPKEQALLLGINTSKFDEEMKELKTAYTAINSVVRDIGSVESTPKVERVDGYALVQEKECIEKHNSEQKDKIAQITKAQEQVSLWTKEASELRDKLESSLKQIDQFQKILKEMPTPESLKSTESITERIKNVDETNRAAEAYERNEEKRIAKDKKIGELANNKIKQGQVNDKRTAYIKAFDFKVEGLSVGEEGGLLLDGRRLTEYSKGEQEVIVAGLDASRKPKLKTRLIDEFQSLDPKNQERIVNGLIKKGFQVITFEVGDKKKDKDTILLRECAVVDDEAKPSKTKLL